MDIVIGIIAGMICFTLLGHLVIHCVRKEIRSIRFDPYRGIGE